MATVQRQSRMCGPGEWVTCMPMRTWQVYSIITVLSYLNWKFYHDHGQDGRGTSVIHAQKCTNVSNALTRQILWHKFISLHAVSQSSRKTFRWQLFRLSNFRWLQFYILEPTGYEYWFIITRWQSYANLDTTQKPWPRPNVIHRRQVQYSTKMSWL